MDRMNLGRVRFGGVSRNGSRNGNRAIMQSARHTEEKEIEGIRRQLRLLDFKTSQAESGITTIQDHIERQSQIYTPQESEKRIANYREIILEATRSKERLETSLNQIAQDKERSQRTKEAFEKIHSENIKRSTFSDWLRIVEILDVKVYPSEDWSKITVTTAIDLAGLDGASKPSLCYKMSIASPILTIGREVRGAKAYLELLLSCQENDYPQASQEAVP